MYVCDTGILYCVWVAVWFAAADTVTSPDDGHIVARNT